MTQNGGALACPECGAAWRDGLTCQACAEQMEAWDFEHWDIAGEVHDLSGLCYHVQHPSLYSPEGLAEAIALLEAYVEQGLAPAVAMRGNQARYRARTWRWTPRDTAAAYHRAVDWTMTAPDVVRSGFEGYPARVRAWAYSVYRALHARPPSESARSNGQAIAGAPDDWWLRAVHVFVGAPSIVKRRKYHAASSQV